MGFFSFLKKTVVNAPPPPLEEVCDHFDDLVVKKYFIISKKEIQSCNTTTRITCAQLTDYNISKEICNTYGHILLEYTRVGGGGGGGGSWKIVN